VAATRVPGSISVRRSRRSRSSRDRVRVSRPHCYQAQPSVLPLEQQRALLWGPHRRTQNTCRPLRSPLQVLAVLCQSIVPREQVCTCSMLVKTCCHASSRLRSSIALKTLCWGLSFLDFLDHRCERCLQPPHVCLASPHCAAAAPFHKLGLHVTPGLVPLRSAPQPAVPAACRAALFWRLRSRLRRQRRRRSAVIVSTAGRQRRLRGPHGRAAAADRVDGLRRRLSRCPAGRFQVTHYSELS